MLYDFAISATLSLSPFVPPSMCLKIFEKIVTSSYKQNNVDEVTVKCTDYYFRKL